MSALPLIRKSGQGRAMLLGYLAFSLLYLGSAALGLRPALMLEPGVVDRLVPMMDWTIWIYLSQFLLLPASIVLAKDDLDRSRIFYGMLAASVAAALFFVAWPTEIMRPAHQSDGPTGLAWTLLYATDTSRNCFPSLHVALAAIAGAGLWRAGYRSPGWVWAVLIVLSTLTTRQHVVTDIAGGLALAPLAWIFTGKIILHERTQPAHRSANS